MRDIELAGARRSLPMLYFSTCNVNSLGCPQGTYYFEVIFLFAIGLDVGVNGSSYPQVE